MKNQDRIEFEYMPLSALVAYPRNPKEHDLGAIGGAINSNVGFASAITIDLTTGYIGAGHGRVEALQQMYNDNPKKPPKRILLGDNGEWLVPTAKVRFADEIELQQFLIQDNRISEIGGWDEPSLADLLTDLAGAGDGILDSTGYDGDDLDELLKTLEPIMPIEDVEPQINKADELQKEWQTARGQVWLVGGVHRVMCGDSTSGEDVARLMGGKRASVVITDPPYGMDLDTDFSSMQSKLFKGKTGGNYHDKIIGDNVDFDPSPIFEFWGYCKEIFLWGCDYYADKIPNRNGGAIFVWDKRLDESADKMWGSSFELCWSKVNHKRDIIRVKWAGIFGMENQDTKSRVHPTQKPTDVIKWIIERYCDPIAITVDPYLGSGTTLIACEQTGRVCYGMEISPEYTAVVLQRAKDAGLECELLP